jgi:hypothetical protein
VERSDALMFFIHPDSLVAPQRIDDGVDEAVRVMEAAEFAEGAGSTQPRQEFIPWEASRASTQAKILDLLQLVIRAKKKRTFPIVVVISAWDLVKNKKLAPDKCLETTAPLVWQFLNANKGKRPYSVYGISAQGADYAHADELRDFIKPSERIVVVSEQQSSSDITKSLLWALE